MLVDAAATRTTTRVSAAAAEAAVVTAAQGPAIQSLTLEAGDLAARQNRCLKRQQPFATASEDTLPAMAGVNTAAKRLAGVRKLNMAEIFTEATNLHSAFQRHESHYRPIESPGSLHYRQIQWIDFNDENDHDLRMFMIQNDCINCRAKNATADDDHGRKGEPHQ